MNILLLSNDLMVSSRVDGAALRAGISAKTVPTIEALAAACREGPVASVIVDLSTPSIDVRVLVEQLSAMGAARPRIVAFGPHVHESLLAAARLAGCDDVISRGQFFAQLDAIVQRSANQSLLGGA